MNCTSCFIPKLLHPNQHCCMDVTAVMPRVRAAGTCKPSTCNLYQCPATTSVHAHYPNPAAFQHARAACRAEWLKLARASLTA